MNEILHANVFFFIASVATVVFCILLSVILVQIIKITKHLRAIIARVDEGSEVLAGDIARARAFFAGGGIVSRLFGFWSKKVNEEDDTEDKVGVAIKKKVVKLSKNRSARSHSVLATKARAISTKIGKVKNKTK